MWLLQFVPNWLFSLLFFLGIVGYLITKTVKVLPMRQTAQVVAVATILFALYMSGAKMADDSWRKKTVDLEKKILELQAESSKTNTEIVTKVVTKQQVIKEKGQDIIRYIDREIVKYDNTCPLPKELLEVHNKAATK
jgi:hypothetical protein